MEQQPTYYVNPSPPQTQQDGGNPWVLRLMLLSFTGLVLLFFSMVALLAGYQFMTQDQIYAGVSPIYGVDVSGMTRAEALAALSEQPAYGEMAEFTFVYADQEWTFSGTELGVNFNAQSTVDTAFNAGRGGNQVENLIDQWRIWRDGYPISPVITYDRNQAQAQLTQLAENYINRPAIEATLTFQNSEIKTSQGQTGLSVDVPAAMALLEQEILAMTTRSSIELVVEESIPSVPSTEEAAARVALALDERGVTFFIPAEYGADAGPWVARPESIENMLRIERVQNDDDSAYYDVYAVLEPAREFLTELSDELSRDAREARFIFNDDVRQLEVIESSVNGRRLNIEATLATFQDAVFSDTERRVPLVFDAVVPTINSNATPEELGIVELVAEATTTYYGSTPPRRANIQVAASRFHGIVLKPGEEFSFNEWLGDVDVSAGFEEALIIFGDQTIEGVGGGVCQVSTTIFQAAFYAGFPILERYAHGYRVSYYEEGEGVGMDAAVYSPTIDFRFQNDTPHYLLIETYVRPAQNSLTFRFYSTSMNRRVVKEGPEIRNEQAPPPPVYRPNPDLNPGEINQTDYPVAGAEVFVFRTVYEGEQVVREREQFYSNYVPWPAQYEVAPGDSRLD